MTLEMPFRFPFRVRGSEVDFQAVAYNAHYLTWFDTTIHEFFKAVPYNYALLKADTGCDFHTVRAVIEFKGPLRLDEDFEVVLRVPRIGRSSLTFDLRAVVGGEADVRTTGELVWVHTDQATRRSAPLPSRLLDRLAAAGLEPG